MSTTSTHTRIIHVNGATVTITTDNTTGGIRNCSAVATGGNATYLDSGCTPRETSNGLDYITRRASEDRIIGEVTCRMMLVGFGYLVATVVAVRMLLKMTG